MKQDRSPASPSIGPETPARLALAILLRDGVEQVAACAQALDEGGETQIHRMRVALRRTRTVLKLVSAHRDGGEPARLAEDLRWIGGKLGAVRDLDVFLSESVAPLRGDSRSPEGLAAFEAGLAAKRSRAWKQGDAALRSARLRAAIARARRWCERDIAAGVEKGEPSIAGFGAAQLAKRWRRLKRAKVRLADLGAGERHVLRIRCKKLRFIAEALADAFPGRAAAKRRDAMLAALRKTQDSLGGLNDVEFRLQLAGRLANGRRPGVAYAVGVIAGREAARTGDLLAAAEASFRKLLKLKPFWA